MKRAGITVIKEGDVASEQVANINVKNLHAEAESTAKVEVTGGKVWFFISDSPEGQPGETYVEFNAGDVTEMNMQQVANALKFKESDEEQFLNVKCAGTEAAHYKITMKGLIG